MSTQSEPNATGGLISPDLQRNMDRLDRLAVEYETFFRFGPGYACAAAVTMAGAIVRSAPDTDEPALIAHMKRTWIA